MSRARVHIFSLSLDGFGTGEGQAVDAPFGHAGDRLLDWFWSTRAAHEDHGVPGGRGGVDDVLGGDWGRGVGASIMGRNMFGPQRGPWPDDGWRGWWGDVPPYHHPVFVLTHHPRPPLEMEGGTTFHFVEASAGDALTMAREAAGGLDVRIDGGPSTVRAFLQADLIDHMHITIVPIVLGRGERLWDGLEDVESRFDVEAVSSPRGVTHLIFDRRS